MNVMKTPRFRLCEADRERYPGPEWLQYDTAVVLDLDLDTLEQIEETLGWTLIELGAQLARGSARGLRAMIWIARKLAGCDDAWASFKPKVWQIEHDESDPVEAVDADPPANRAERRAAAKAAPRKSASRSRARASAS